MTSVRNILALVDFSSNSLRALRHARDLARIFKGHLYILHVTPIAQAPSWALEIAGLELHRIAHDSRAHSQALLASLTAAESLDPSATTVMVLAGRPEQVIAAYASEIGAELIVMGLHGQDQTPPGFLGRVADRVLRHAPCPVLAVPAIDDEVAAGDQRPESRAIA